MLNIGPQELLIVLIIALVVVGPQRLPELGRTIGKVLREFRKIQDDVKDTLKFDLDDDPAPYVRPKHTPRAPAADEKADAATEDTLPEPESTAPTGASEGVAPIQPSGNGQVGADPAPETESHPEPRAAE
jgi:Tat protein translocase TatB subunit